MHGAILKFNKTNYLPKKKKIPLNLKLCLIITPKIFWKPKTVDIFDTHLALLNSFTWKAQNICTIEIHNHLHPTFGTPTPTLKVPKGIYKTK